MSQGKDWSRTTRTMSPLTTCRHSHWDMDVPLNLSVREMFC